MNDLVIGHRTPAGPTGALAPEEDLSPRQREYLALNTGLAQAWPRIFPGCCGTRDADRPARALGPWPPLALAPYPQE